MSKHTPVRWKVVRSCTCGHLRAAHNYREDPREEWTDEDIKLIEAAPNLLAACKSAFDAINKMKSMDDHELHVEAMGALYAAIQLAEEWRQKSESVGAVLARVRDADKVADPEAELSDMRGDSDDPRHGNEQFCGNCRHYHNTDYLVGRCHVKDPYQESVTADDWCPKHECREDESDACVSVGGLAHRMGEKLVSSLHPDPAASPMQSTCDVGSSLLERFVNCKHERADTAGYCLSCGRLVRHTYELSASCIADIVDDPRPGMMAWRMGESPFISKEMTTLYHGNTSGWSRSLSAVIGGAA